MKIKYGQCPLFIGRYYNSPLAMSKRVYEGSQEVARRRTRVTYPLFRIRTSLSTWVGILFEPSEP